MSLLTEFELIIGFSTNKEVAQTRLDCGWVVTRCSCAAPASARQLSRSRGWRGSFFGGGPLIFIKNEESGPVFRIGK